MKRILLFVGIVISLNVLITGLLQSKIKVIGGKINQLESLYSANHTKHSFLIRERQDLMRRDRIITYAQENLRMKLLKPDEIASGSYIKEIVENETRNNVIYSFIDMITPPLHAFEIR